MPEGQPMPSGKKLVRKVKKGAASGISKTDINGLIMPSSAGLTSGSVTATTKMGPSKNNISHQHPSSAFGSNSHVIGVASSRVLSGNSHSAGTSGMKS